AHCLAAMVLGGLTAVALLPHESVTVVLTTVVDSIWRSMRLGTCTKVVTMRFSSWQTGVSTVRFTGTTSVWKTTLGTVTATSRSRHSVRKQVTWRSMQPAVAQGWPPGCTDAVKGGLTCSPSGP